MGLKNWILTTVMVSSGVAMPGIAHAQQPAEHVESAEHARVFGTGRIVLDDLLGVGTSAPAPLVGESLVGGLGGVGFARGVAGYASQSSDASSVHMFWLAPAGDVFLTQHWSLGVRLTASFIRSDAGSGATATYIRSQAGSFMPRIGYFLPVGDSGGVWLRVGAGVGHQVDEQTSPDVTVANGTTESSRAFNTFMAQADASYVLGLGHHFLLALGPELTVARIVSESDQGHPASGSVALGGRASLGLVF